jgi:uncharacterized phage protein gp47/JayE
VASFQLKDFASIAASLINMMSATQNKVTDFNVGSIVRTMLEAIAAELDELYQQMLNGLLQAIPVAVYNSFTFPALIARPSSGVVQVLIATQTTDTLIASGTLFTAASNGNTYASSGDVTILAGATSSLVPVVATVSGSASNLGATTAFTLSPAPSGFVSASNPNAYINGTDDETAAAQLIRFNGYISTLQRGTNAAIVYGAKTSTVTDSAGNVIEQVASAVVVEPYLTNTSLPISSIYCYIHNGVGSTSSALVAQTQAVINGYTAADGVTLVPGWKSAGVVCTVAAATEQPITVTGNLTAAAGYVEATLIAQAVSVVSAYLLAIPAGAPAIFALIETLVMTIPGVANFVISAPTADRTATASNYKIMPGTITIT